MNAVAAAVGAFFRELPQPLLTKDLYAEFTRTIGRPDTYMYILALRIRIMLATFLSDVTATFLSVTDTYICTYIMRIDPGLESSLCSQLCECYIFRSKYLECIQEGYRFIAIWITPL